MAQGRLPVSSPAVPVDIKVCTGLETKVCAAESRYVRTLFTVWKQSLCMAK